MCTAIKCVQLNRKHHMNKRKIQTHQSGWVTSAMKISAGQQAGSPERSGWSNGNQAPSRCATWAQTPLVLPRAPLFLWHPRSHHRTRVQPPGNLPSSEPGSVFLTHLSALFQIKIPARSALPIFLSHSWSCYGNRTFSFTVDYS